MIDGVAQVKPSSIRVRFEANNQEVDTLEGLAGKTPGSGKVRISCTGAIPIGGPENDWLTSCVEGSYHAMQVPFGVKSYIGNGWFDTAEIGQSVNGSTEIQFEWTGEFNKPK
jgi:hypothetical protein